MNVNAVGNDYSGVYTEQVKTVAPKTEEAVEKNASEGVVYEKSADADSKKGIYTINKMSPEDRANLVKQIKADQQAQEQNFLNIVAKMFTGQSKSFAIAMNSEEMWKTIANGEFSVDEATKAQAQKDISEDGYWGVKQTSQRLFDFASALAGDDVEKMKEMQAAMEKGFKQATKAWGGELPGICQDTMKAANKLFDDYYASKNGTQTQEVE